MNATIYTIPAPDSLSGVIEVYGDPENALRDALMFARGLPIDVNTPY